MIELPPQRHGENPRGNDATEHRAASGLGIRVEVLRVVLARKFAQLALGDRARPRLARLTLDEILVVAHRAALLANSLDGERVVDDDFRAVDETRFL